MEPQLGFEVCPSCLDTKSQITTGSWRLPDLTGFPGDFPAVAEDKECGRKLALLQMVNTAEQRGRRRTTVASVRLYCAHTFISGATLSEPSTLYSS